MTMLEVRLTQGDARIVLECLVEQEKRLALVCDSSDDEDEVADAGNDLVELRLLLKSLRQMARACFGPAVENFDRTPL